MARSCHTFLMFEGVAEQSLFDGAIESVERWGPEGPGAEGSIKLAALTIAGHHLLCSDSPVKHAFTFTPSISLFVDCDSETELDSVFEQLSTGGGVLMPLDAYGFSRKFGWVNDRFGVS